MPPVLCVECPKDVMESATVHLYLVVGQDIMDVDAPEHSPVRIGTETCAISAYVCDRHDPGYGRREDFIPEGWELLEDNSDRLPE